MLSENQYPDGCPADIAPSGLAITGPASAVFGSAQILRICDVICLAAPCCTVLASISGNYSMEELENDVSISTGSGLP